MGSCMKPSDHAQFVTYKTSAGESVIAAVLGTGSLGFVLAPKVIDNACVWLPYARTLRDRGDRALLFDWGRVRLVRSRERLPSLRWLPQPESSGGRAPPRSC